MKAKIMMINLVSAKVIADIKGKSQVRCSVPGFSVLKQGKTMFQKFASSIRKKVQT